MTVEHKDIGDPNRHEPRGISTAASKTHYVANGAGSGTWQKTDSTELLGLTGDGGVADKHIVTNGLNGFKLVSGSAYGSMAITNNSTNFAVTAVADTTFNTPSQFTLLSGGGAPWAADIVDGVTFSTDKLTVPVTGVYFIDTYLNIGAYPSGTARVSIRYLVNGTTYSSRNPTVKSGGTASEGQLVGFGLINLTAGNTIQLTVASDTTGNLLIKNANVVMRLVRNIV